MKTTVAVAMGLAVMTLASHARAADPSASGNQEPAAARAATPVSATMPAAPAPSSSGPEEPIVVRDHRTVRSYPANLGHNMLEVWNRKSIPALLGGGALTAAGFMIDGDTRTYFQRHEWKRYGEAGRILGTGAVAFGASAAVFGVGRYANGDRFRAASYDMSQAVVVNFLYTLAIKEAVRRKRPDGADKLSFPSGHASNAFACATVWAEQYGIKAAVPGYVAATLVAGSRLAAHKHHVSDIAGGAVLGYVVGKSVARWDAKPSHKPVPVPRVSVLPDAGPDGTGMGVAVAVRF